MRERNAKVLNQLKARRNAIVKAKKVKLNKQFQNQVLLFLALCNLWRVYQPSMASEKKSIPVRNAAVIAVTTAVMIAATAATIAAVTAATIAATTVAATAASLAAVATAASHAAAVATSAAAPVATAATVATIAHAAAAAAAAAAAVRSPRHNSIPLLWLLLPRLPPPARNTTEVEVLSLRLK